MAKNKHPPTHRAEQAAVTVEETLVTEKKKRRTTHLMNFKQCALPAKFEYNEHRWTNKDWCSVFSHKSCFGFHLLSDTMNRFKTFISGTFICLGKISLES